MLQDVKLVERLIKHGAELDAKNTKKLETALYAAVHDLAIVRLLVEAGADINWKNNKDETPLYRAYQKGTPQVIEYLMAQGADLSSQKDPMDIASRSNNVQVVNWLMGKITK